MSKERKELRVKPFRPPPEREKITFRLPVPTIAGFEKYLAAYAELYHVKADRDFVMNEILIAFFESDRTFAAYLKNTSATKAVPEETVKVSAPVK